MEEVSIYGIDLAKQNFHIVGINASGQKIFAKKLKREEMLPFLANDAEKSAIFAMEACGGCHFWAGELAKLNLTAKLLKTKDVKPYCNAKQKNDSNDALGIAKAARDPELKAVHAKTREEQEIMLLHMLRENSKQSRIRASNSLMSRLLEFGYITKSSKANFGKAAALEIEHAFAEHFLSLEVKNILLLEAEEIAALYKKEARLEKEIIAKNKASEEAKRLQTIIGIGPINASLFSIMPMESYDNPRDFAASLGLVPWQHTTGGNIQLGRITKQGSTYARTMLIQGARTVVMQARIAKDPTDKLVIWAKKLLKNKGFNQVCVAVANKLARIAHAVVTQKTHYNPA